MKIWLLNTFMLLSVALIAQSKVNNFTQIEIDGPVIIELVAGEQPGVTILKGENQVNWEVNGKALVIMARYRKNQDTPEVRVTVTQLEALETTGSVIINGQGVFAARNLDLTISSQSIVALEVDVEDLDAEVESQSILTLSGNADDFDLSLDTQSIVNAEDLKSGVINVQANRQSVATINSNGAKLTKQVSNQSLVVE
ncbi:GIN domain-containing protein [Lewinella cohaerens]|uniref:GIN domain-containing protein n=1 Tax=Lewinella cohaerens TaxID=70995 RepID=UPI00036EFF3E|nr:DUF2807 domain-containing protein [Lewinella cohaerens]